MGAPAYGAPSVSRISTWTRAAIDCAAPVKDLKLERIPLELLLLLADRAGRSRYT
jgi:hypothetical protein